MKKLLSLTIVVFVIGLILASAGYYLTRDEPPPQDDDLRVERLNIPEKENAFYYFNLACEGLDYPDDGVSRDHIAAIMQGDLWDAEFVHELLERNAESLQNLQKGLACSQCQVPEIKSSADPMPYLETSRSLARLTLLSAISLLKQGKGKEALDAGMDLVRFGHMIEGSGGMLIHYLVGIAVKAIGLDRLRRIVPDATLDADQMREYAEKLAEYKADEQRFMDVFRVEYTLGKRTTDDLAAGKLDFKDLGPANSTAQRRGLMRHFLQPNRTKRILAQAYRVSIENVPRTYAERDYCAFPQLPENTGYLAKAKLILSRNAVGKVLVAMLLPAMERAHLAKCRENVTVAATRLLFALKAYELEKGKLPDSLDELVPDYIKAIPLDDMDGKPMRYSREKKIVYSVGEDLADSGGCEGEHPWEMEDPSFKIEF